MFKFLRKINKVKKNAKENLSLDISHPMLLLDKRRLWENEIDAVLNVSNLEKSRTEKLSEILSVVKIDFASTTDKLKKMYPELESQERIIINFLDNGHKKIWLELKHSSSRFNLVSKDSLLVSLYYQEGPKKVKLNYYSPANFSNAFQLNGEHFIGKSYLREENQRKFITGAAERDFTILQHLNNSLWLNLSLSNVESENERIYISEAVFPWANVRMIIEEVNKIQNMKNEIYLANLHVKLKEQESSKIDWLPNSLSKEQYQNILSEELASYNGDLATINGNEVDQLASKVMDKISAIVKEQIKARDDLKTIRYNDRREESKLDQMINKSNSGGLYQGAGKMAGARRPAKKKAT